MSVEEKPQQVEQVEEVEQEMEQDATPEEQQAALAALMTEVSPVSALVLKADGSIEQVTLDLSPRANGVAGLLGGQAEFIGAFYQSDVFLLQRQLSETHGLPRSTQRLPAPFTNYPVFGDALVVRMDEESNPQPLGKLDWLRILETSTFDEPDAENCEDDEEVEVEAENEDEEEEEASDGEGGVNPEVLHLHLVTRISEAFEAENGREPTVDEIKDILRNILEAQQGEGGDESGDEAVVADEVDENDEEEEEYTPTEDPEAEAIEEDNKRSLSEMRASDEEAKVDAANDVLVDKENLPQQAPEVPSGEADGTPVKRRRTRSSRDVSEAVAAA